MVTSDLGACEWFVWDLRRSGLIDRGQLDQIVGDFLRRNPRAEPPALADFLIQQQVLTAFQSERILSGKSQGLVLGPYVLIDAIGQGSMGQVYKASSKSDNQLYAIKVLPRRSMWNVRLARRQVRAFSQVNHPAVVPFVDVGTSGGQHYLAWPLVEGETLEAKIAREGKLTPGQAAQVGLQVAQGLAVCHQNGIFHGLLKPSNIMIGRDGQARVLDFGIGSLLVENEGESLVDTMSTANTLTSGLDCCSPESIMEPTNRTPAGDQYSLGCVLYYCLAGQYPFPDGTAVEKMMAHQFKQPPSIHTIDNTVPQPVVDVVEKLMQKAPESRFGDADEIVESLQPFANETALPRRSNSYNAPRAQYDSRNSRSSMPSIPEVATSGPKSHMGTAIPTASPASPHNPGAKQSWGATSPDMRTPNPPPSGMRAPTPAPVANPVGYGSNAGLPAVNTGSNAGFHPGSSFNTSRPPSARDSHYNTTPGWVPEEPRKFSILGVLLVLGIAAAVALLVLYMGKNFLPKT
ncbi:protein kinase [Telmatocola sphagniphila]|uniref:Protein kinase n=1 Tax=Telmatocola sphagniphila TaxID=1123043 RepID=A0A8E6EVJ4_9BACT|nr:protein kinase [Telmatocola sphagniphila]QVL32815.1 protein kinase [Telmatocola sphagniphila]